MKTVSHEEMLEKYIGKQGTSERNEYEAELQADVIAYHLKQLRINQQLTQQQLADLVGIDKTQISKIENGSRNLTIETITKIANALGAKVNFSIQV